MEHHVTVSPTLQKNADQVATAVLDSSRINETVSLFSAQLHEHGIDASTANLRTVMENIIAEPARGFMLVATVDGGAVGVAYVATIISLEHGGDSAWLEELFVLPDWRGRGIGSRLLAEAIAAAAARGWRALDLEVDSTHERAAALYLRNGFQQRSRKRFVRFFNNQS